MQELYRIYDTFRPYNAFWIFNQLNFINKINAHKIKEKSLLLNILLYA